MRRLQTLLHPRRRLRPAQRRHYWPPIGENYLKRGPRGYDAGKKALGRKRHIVVDTAGLLLAAVAHPADIQDRAGARPAPSELAGKLPQRRLIWADGAYRGALSEWGGSGWAAAWRLYQSGARHRGFAAPPRRWIVERTLGWLGQRRWSKDYEELPESSAAWAQIALRRLMLRRLAQEPAF